ncbi:MAG: GPW/gp25 family protein [Bacteroidota bacterium]
MEENEFLGRGWSFPPQFYDGGKSVKMVSGEEDIRQSLQILLSTALNERTLNSRYGCELDNFLFEGLTQGVLNDIENTISKAILNHETRILVNAVELNDSSENEGVIIVNVDYTVQMTNNRFNLVFPFYINEAVNA